MKVNFAHLCDYALLSADGKMSILGIFAHIGVPQLPAVHALHYLAFEVEMSPSELGHQMRIELRCAGPDGQVIARADAQFQVDGRGQPGSPIRLPQIVPIGGLQLTVAGPHGWSIFVNGVHQIDLGFEVRVAALQPPAAQ